jgi:peptidoglycan hydrolase-like protein with peptidoglycan-binding domain
VLEACFEDRARLTVGAHGAPVEKVQRALIDVGIGVGPSGADGRYGPATWDAVKQFKAREHLGFETMGDVGPGTMHRLDALFGDPSNPSAERATEGGLPSASDFVITDDDGAIEVAAIPAPPDESALTAAFLARPAVEQVAGQALAPQQAAAHISGDEAVSRFKQKIDVANPAAPGTNVHQKGQFFWGRQLGIAVEAEINALRAAPGATDFCDKARGAFEKIMNFEDGTAELATAARAAQASKSPAKPIMIKLVHGLVTGGAAIEAQLWAALDKRPDDSMPDLGPLLSLLTLRTVRKFDRIGCTVHMLRTAERIKSKGGLTGSKPGGSAFFATLSSGTGFRDNRPVDSANRYFGDVLNQTGVASAVAGLKTALDNGRMVHARVLSGVGLGTVPQPDPKARRTPMTIPSSGEHSVLIIGYDGDRFVFSDPDAAVSKDPEAGFGRLFFDGTRLSTARDEGDLAVDTNGEHASGNHRYQVLFLASV